MTARTPLAPTFPGDAWERVTPAQAGMDPACVEAARDRFVETMGDARGRLVVVRGGRLVLEHNHGLEAGARPGIASAAKSIYANVLGIVVAEGKLDSADELVVDHFPEMMDVAEGEGNKPGRWAFPENRGITFRHLICNVSGYLKPGEAPGRVFNYQTWGMNVLTHALAKLYGLYDAGDPEGSPGFRVLIEEKLARPLGADWEYSVSSPPPGDRLQAGAKLAVFGGYTGVHSTALDLARVGWLWCNEGRWDGRQVVPAAWQAEIAQVAPDILAHSPARDWVYGHGIWTNAEGRLWPDLPREGFTASGAGGHTWTVFPSRQLVVVQNPGRHQGADLQQMASPAVLRLLLDACDG